MHFILLSAESMVRFGHQMDKEMPLTTVGSTDMIYPVRK
jgi:hypothetical protein